MRKFFRNSTANAPDANTTYSPSILAKLGCDKQIDNDLRIRLNWILLP